MDIQHQASPDCRPPFMSNARPMRVTVTSLGLLVAVSANATPSTFDGLWFTCLPEMASRPSPYALVQVRREAGRLAVLGEWGGSYSASGLGVVSGGKLTARGCATFRGEPTSECEESAAPVFFELTESQARGPHQSTELALRRSEPIRTTADSWRSLAAECKAVVQDTR